MKCLTVEEANRYLLTIGMQIGDWNQIADVSVKDEAISYVHYQAPSVARHLLCFSRHVAGWLPRGDWKIVQIDNSNASPMPYSRFCCSKGMATLFHQGAHGGERLAVQDGAIQFLSRDESMGGAEMLLRRFEREPARHPQWVVDAVAADQQPLFPA